MFVEDLEAPKKDLLFDLIILLLMSQQQSDIAVNDIDAADGNAVLLLPFVNTLHEVDLKLLNNVAKQLGIHRFIGQHQIHINKKIFSYSDNAALANDQFFNLGNALIQNAKAIIDEYSSNAYLHAEVMDHIVRSGIDFFNITPEIIRVFTVNLPNIRKKILQQATRSLIEIQTSKNIALTSREKKIVIYNLIYFLIKRGQLLNNDDVRSLLNTISIAIGLDVEYIEEFEELLVLYIQIDNDLLTLINE